MVTKPTLNAKGTEDVKKKPIQVFRAGQVKASIWENEYEIDGKKKKGHSVSIVRSYKAKDSEEWTETNSYNADNLADLETVAQEARRYLRLKDQ
jgi:hypothetical protein